MARLTPLRAAVASRDSPSAARRSPTLPPMSREEIVALFHDRRMRSPIMESVWQVRLRQQHETSCRPTRFGDFASYLVSRLPSTGGAAPMLATSCGRGCARTRQSSTGGDAPRSSATIPRSRRSTATDRAPSWWPWCWPSSPWPLALAALPWWCAVLLAVLVGALIAHWLDVIHEGAHNLLLPTTPQNKAAANLRLWSPPRSPFATTICCTTASSVLPAAAPVSDYGAAVHDGRFHGQPARPARLPPAPQGQAGGPPPARAPPGRMPPTKTA